MNLATKYAITAFLVVVISETAKKSDRLGALLASLPLVTLLVLFWLYVDRQPNAKLASHAWYTFWYVLGSLPFFLIFPFFLGHFGPPLALLASTLVTLALFFAYALALARFGIQLL